MKTPHEQAAVAALGQWFERAARDLPWRRNRDGYCALVAEAMLQQTQVSRVVDRYESFIRRFPDVQSLAAADEQEVLAMWQGLGYYRRARHLHAAARFIVDELAGDVPDHADALRQLPGVGRYTAGAIASIVHGESTAVVDGNVRRVLARWYAQAGQPDDPQTLQWTWQTAQRLVDQAEQPGVFNEAMMELGATICTPAKPKCEACPVSRWCIAQQHDHQNEIPAPRKAPTQQNVFHHVLVVERAGRLLIEQRPATGLWSNMWQLPTIEAAEKLTVSSLRARVDFTVGNLAARDFFVHKTTHRRVHFVVYSAVTRRRKGTWIARDQLSDYPMSNPQRRIIRAALNLNGASGSD